MQKLQLPKLRKISDTVTTEPRKKKKKILLLSDDLRQHSGIGTMSREIVINTCHEYDWVQLAAGLKHPEHGKIIDISADVARESGVADASVRLYAHNGYGNPVVLEEIINIEKPDAILHFTDPRFWLWLYEIEHELRQRMPLMYYNIWDDLPYPLWNEPYYESCDLLMNISRQTQNIVKNVLRRNPKPDWAVQWVPHGINERYYFPIQTDTPEWEQYEQFVTQFKQNHNCDFIVFWTNRNQHRKHPADVILSYKTFCDKLPPEKASKCVLLMHTAVVDENGTDLIAVKNAICPNYKVVFSTVPVDTKTMNYFYNMADVTINIGSNEGFGLSSAESIMAGTVVINNVTGGLQDHCRFVDENDNWIEFTTDFPSNHTGKYKICGCWAKPVFPTNRSLQGSPLTPYIFDDRCDFNDVADAIMYWYNIDRNLRKHYGVIGRAWLQSNESNMSARRMGVRMIECINTCLENWKPRERYVVFKVTVPKPVENIGII